MRSNRSTTGPSILAVEVLVGASLFADFLLVTMVIPIAPQIMSAKRAGMLFAAKPLAQAVCNPFLAYFFPTFNAAVLRVGVVLGMLSAAAFGSARGFHWLVLWRCLQGAASAAIMTGGMSFLLGICGNDERRRSQAVSRALLGLTLGVSLGPVVGGVGYDALGREATFELVAVGMVVIAILQSSKDWQWATWNAQVADEAADSGDAETAGLRSSGGSRGDDAPPSAWLDRRVLTCALAMFMVSCEVGALEPSVMYGLRKRAWRPWASGVLWGVSVPAVHALTTFAIGLIEPRGIEPELEGDHGIHDGMRPRHWVTAGLVLASLGLPMVGVSLGAVGDALLGEGLSVAFCVLGLVLQGGCLGCVVSVLTTNPQHARTALSIIPSTHPRATPPARHPPARHATRAPRHPRATPPAPAVLRCSASCAHPSLRARRR